MKKSHSGPISIWSFCLSTLATAGLRPEVEMAMLKAPRSTVEGTIKGPQIRVCGHITPDAELAGVGSNGPVQIQCPRWRWKRQAHPLEMGPLVKPADPSYRFFRTLLFDPCRNFTGDEPYVGPVFEQGPYLALTYLPAPTTRQVRPSTARKRG